MTISSYATALSHIDTLMASKSCAQIRADLTHSKSNFLQWLDKESHRLEDAAQEGIENILRSPDKVREFQDYYNLFLTIEEKGNELDSTASFGSVLCKKIAGALSCTKTFTREFIDIVSLDKRQKFDTLVCNAVPEQLKKNKDAEGLRSFMSSLSTSALSPASQETITSVLAEALNAVETSKRFEILARVDAYIRSGHARADIEGNTLDAQKLRDALAKVAATQGSKSLHKAAANQAILELFVMLDTRMHKVKIVDGKAIDHGSFVYQPGYNPKKNMPMCVQLAEKGVLDFAIPVFGQPGKWLTGMTTSMTDVSWLNRESVQRFHHGNENITWWYVDPRRGKNEPPRPLPGQTASFAVIYSALINTNSKKNKLADQLGVEIKTPLVQSINDLVILQLLSNTKNPTESTQIHIGCIGAEINIRLATALGTPQFSEVAATQLIEAVNGLSACTVDGNKIAASSALVDALHLSASLLNAHAESPYLLEHAPVEEWEPALKKLQHSLEKESDFSGLKALRGAVGFLSSQKNEYFRASSDLSPA